jgi:mono/diheme cytochrome c family protein
MNKLIGTGPAFLFVVVVVTSVTAGFARAQQTGSAQQGLSLAREVCSQCHLVVKKPGLSVNPDAPSFEAIANTNGLTSTALLAMLQTSHRTMPNIVVKGQDAQDIIAYILSLKEGN